MMKILYAEIMKLKGSKILWLIPIGAFFPCLLNLFILINEGATGFKMSWLDLFGNNVSMMVLMIGPTLLALLTGYIVSREFQENTINSLFTYPANRWQFIFVKTILMLGVTALLFVLDYFLCIAIGWGFISEPFTADIAWATGKSFLFAIVVQFLLIPLVASLAIVGKNLIPAISLGILSVVLSMMAVNWEYAECLPWTAAYMLVASKINPDLLVDSTTSIITLVITFSVPFIFNLFYYSKMNVHSGS